MRSRRIAFGAVAVALFAAAPAAASFGPPLVGVPKTLRTLPVIQVKTARERAPSSCSAHAQRSRGAVGRVERKLAPVACEQPPRSKLLDTGIMVFLAP